MAAGSGDEESAVLPADHELPEAPEDGARAPGTALSRGWRNATQWRRSRPFWAGIVLIAAGAEILLIPLPMHSFGLILHIGTGGVLGVLIGALLISCALLLWFNPEHRTFYAIVAVLLAIGALVASNLGGFLFGTLLGVLGGSLGFAWVPRPDGREDREDRDGPDDADDADDADADEPAGRRPGWRRRIPAHAGQPGALTLLFRGRAAAAGSGAPDDDPGADGPDDARGGLGGTFYHAIQVAPLLLALGLASQPSGTAAPGGILPPLSPSPSASGTPSPGTSSGASPSPSPSASPSASPKASRRAARRAAVAGGLVAAAEAAEITADSATLTGLAFDGVATVQTASGPEQALKFSMTALSLTGDKLTVTQGGRNVTIAATSFNFTGNVTLLTTKFSGSFLGVPLTFTPRNPPPLVLRVMTFTNVTSDQPFTSADSFQIGGLQISSG
jgi:hypothetical protein